MENKHLTNFLDKLSSAVVENTPPRLYRVRFLWCSHPATSEDDDDKRFCFRVVEDTIEGILSFYETLVDGCPDLVALSCEYLGEYDCSECGLIHNLLSPVDSKEE